ncbi:YybH family protein [Portibacter marinus]|uniref:YybH family protein n=1 Tax=Portibacter marinus TaxID=2898660 RepID=UPI001F17D543|nr:hypothetical protein [Portibacter marinus]
MHQSFFYLLVIIPSFLYSQSSKVVALNGIDDVIHGQSTDFQIYASLDSTISYAVLIHEGTSSKYASIQIREENEVVLEWYEKATFPLVDLNKIEERRQAWMDLCNAHDAAKLVRTLYSKDAVYFNHRPLIIGHEAIAVEYDYMNRQQYELDLTPIYIKAVNDQCIFEIGQCSGSYNGKYVLIWEKEQNGIWNIKMDSNK